MSRHGENEEAGWLRAQLERVTAERDKLRRHLEAREELDRVLMQAAPAADGTGPIARVQGPRAQGHRTPREARWLKVVPGFALAALASLRWAWHVHRAATVVTGALTLTAATGAAVAVAPHGPVAQVFGAAPAVSAPAPGLYGAAPIGGPSSPSPLRLIGSVTRPSLDAKSAAGHPPVVSVPVPASSQPPQHPSPSQSSQSSQPSPPDTFTPVTQDSPQPQWQDTQAGGWNHHRPDGQDSPQPTVTPSADTATPTMPAAPSSGVPATDAAATDLPSPTAS